MKITTIKIPTSDNYSKTVMGHQEVSGVEVGPFIVHKAISKRGYTVTHSKTGFSAQQELPTKKRAMWLAKRLSSVDVDWGFDDYRAVKTWPKARITEISILRADAMSGDCQGEIP